MLTGYMQGPTEGLFLVSEEPMGRRKGQNGSNSHPKAGLSWPSLPIPAFGWELEPFWPLRLPIEPLYSSPRGTPYEAGNYRGASFIRKRPTLGPYSRPAPRALWWSWEVGVFL